jgi:hypothetical protein
VTRGNVMDTAVAVRDTDPEQAACAIAKPCAGSQFASDICRIGPVA